MNRSLIVPSCLLVFLVSPIVCLAQLNIPADGSTGSKRSAAVVSVRQLEIPEKAHAACSRGIERFAAKDSAGSIPEFQKAIKIFPDYFEAYARLGAAEMDLDRWDDAEAAFRKSIELSDGHYAPANFGLALILATVTKQFPEAEAAARAGLEENPDDETGNFVLAWVLYSTSRLKEAEEVAREAILSDPKFAGARLLLAQIHREQNNPAAVVEDLDAYLTLGISGPSDAKILAARAEAQRALAKRDANPEVVQTR